MPKIAAGATNKNISLAPNGTGKVVVGTGAADATVQSDGDHNLILQTGNSTTSKIEINDGANGDVAITPNGTGNLTIDNIAISDNTIKSTDPNGNIDITPDGTGEVNISKVDIDSGAIDGTTIATSDVTVGSGKTLDVSAGTLTSSTAQKQAIVDGADIEGEDILSTGETGTFLGADGDDSSSWQSISGTLPSQTGNAEKILKTSGSAASWTATRKLIASTDGIQRSDATAVLSEDGSNVATLDNVSLGSSVVFPAGHAILLSTQDAATDASIIFSSSIVTSTYTDYILDIVNAVPSETAHPYLAVSIDDSTALEGVLTGRHYMELNGSGAGQEYNSEAFAVIGYSISTTTSYGGISSRVFMPGMRNTNSNKQCGFLSTGHHSNGDSYAWHGGFECPTTNAINYIEFYFSAGTVKVGRLNLYGIKQ